MRSWNNDRAIKGTTSPAPLLDAGARKKTTWLEGRCGWLCYRTSPFSYLPPSPKAQGRLYQLTPMQCPIVAVQTLSFWSQTPEAACN